MEKHFNIILNDAMYIFKELLGWMKPALHEPVENFQSGTFFKQFTNFFSQ